METCRYPRFNRNSSKVCCIICGVERADKREMYTHMTQKHLSLLRKFGFAENIYQ